jgi:hypothetical protein
VTVAAETTTPLELPGGSVPVLLFAGGATGLVLLAGDGPARALCAGLGEAAEEAGLSALAFAGPIPGDPADAAAGGAGLLDRLGVDAGVLVALGEDAAAALRAAGRGAFAAVVLVEPRVAADELEALLADVPVAKLLLVRGGDAEAQATAAEVIRHAIGPLVVQHLPGEDLVGGGAPAMIAEATIAFAVGACGDGRRV